MKKSDKQNPSTDKEDLQRSRSDLESFFIDSLQELYYSEKTITKEFGNIKDHIISPKLKEILEIHYSIHLKHKERLEKIFKLRNESIKTKKCRTVDVLVAEAKSHLSIFSHDIVNWEIALILVSQKFSYNKIASYGGLAHVAINLNYYQAATLLAVSAQAEDEFIVNKINGLFDAFLASHVEGYKS